MTSNVDRRTEVALLLTVQLTGGREEAAEPLSPTEWSSLVSWLAERGQQPEGLIGRESTLMLAEMRDPNLAVDRIERLLDRGASLGLSIEKWGRAGLWIMAQTGAAYPDRLKELLGASAPPVLFGCGDQTLLTSESIAIVGSRSTAAEHLAIAAEAARRVSQQRLSVVTGAAPGVDQEAIRGGLKGGGAVIGVLSAGLLRAATSKEYRQGLIDQTLTLVSPFSPEAKSQAGHVTARNRIIYALSVATIVVFAESGPGGTSTGLRECLQSGWAPVWISSSTEAGSLADDLLEAGARWLPDEFQIENLRSPSGESPSAGETAAEPVDETLDSLYESFVRHLRQQLEDEPRTSQEIGVALDLGRGQLRIWLKQAQEDGHVEKLTRPVRYRLLAKRLL